MLNKLVRLYNTVKYLKFKQIYWRIIYLLPRLITQQKKYPPPQICKQTDFFIPRDGITVDYQSFTFLSELNNIKFNHPIIVNPNQGIMSSMEATT